MLWAGLQAGPVHVLQNTSEGIEGEQRDGEGCHKKTNVQVPWGLAAPLKWLNFLFHY